MCRLAVRVAREDCCHYRARHVRLGLLVPVRSRVAGHPCGVVVIHKNLRTCTRSSKVLSFIVNMSQYVMKFAIGLENFWHFDQYYYLLAI
jgi:hypothetical protein